MRFLACALLLGSLIPVPASAQSPRLRFGLDDGWRFHAGDAPGAEAPAFDDAPWTAVELPHTWNAQDALVKETPYRRGIGWYRRNLELPRAAAGKRLFLFFEGADQVADVWVNGKEAGHHVGGYTAFAMDVTDLVARAGPNVVAVRVDNSYDPDIPPLTADFDFYGGIYRDVWLVATDAVHFAVTDHASPGVFIDARGMQSAEHAAARVRGTITNDGDAARRLHVVSRILDAAGNAVATLTSDVRVVAHGTADFTQRSTPLLQPHLWSPDDPYLYTVRTEIREAATGATGANGDRVLDRLDTPLGFRWYSYDAQKGFFLNGKPLQLHGTNRHQDVRGLGNALPDALHRRDLRLIKDQGFDFLRLAHYPQDPAVLDEADRIGIILWEEVPVVNTITQSEHFAESAEGMLTDMIRQHYNHPSVFFWGYMNEVLLRPPEPTPANYVSDVVALARRLNERAHAEDSTRSTVMAVIAHNPSPELDAVPDILGLNLYFGWYYGTLPDFGAYVDSVHAAEPRRPLMISEYGAGGDHRIHSLQPRRLDFSSEYERVLHEGTFTQILARPWLLGSALWNMFDFGIWSRDDAQPMVNDKGLFTFDRQPKDVASYYRALLRRDQPVLHIAARDWPLRAGSSAADREQPVQVYANLERVELFLDGRSLGARPVENGSAIWTVTLHDGENRLEARADFQGKPVSDAALVRYVDRSPLFASAGSPAGDAAVARAPASAEIAVNAGSAAQYVDPTGVIWEADRVYHPGLWGYVGGKPAETHHRILATSDDPLLQTTRDSLSAYRFDVPDGRWRVELRFVEIAHDAAGERVLDVRVNGVPAATALDLAASPGRWHARTIVLEVDAVGGQGVVVELSARAGATTISGIRVRRL